MAHVRRTKWWLSPLIVVAAAVAILATGMAAQHAPSRRQAAAGPRAAAVARVDVLWTCVPDNGTHNLLGWLPFEPDCGPAAQSFPVARANVVAPPATTTTTTTTTAATTTTRPVTTTTTPATTTTRPATTTTTRPAGVPGICPTARPASTYGPTYLTVASAAQLLYGTPAVGFHSADQIRTMVGIANAESGRNTTARRWHPDRGCRPHSDVLGVIGPPAAWDSTHFRQLHSDRGWLQESTWFYLHSPTVPFTISDAQADDPPTAAGFAWRIYSTQGGFSQWDVYPGSQSGAPTLAAVCAAVPQAIGC